MSETTATAEALAAPIQEERLIKLFKDLCLINAPALHEKESVAWTRQFLEAQGFEVWEDHAGAKIGGNANNLIVRLKGNKAGAPSIFFSSHFDTVEPTEGLVIEERDGVFYSASDTILGADDKAGMAPMIEALIALKDADAPRGDVYLLLNVAEEIGLKGAAVLELDDLNLDFGYVFDTGPPVGSFVTRTATHDKLVFKITGRPAHAGKHPEEGINAIEVAARAIAGMKLGRIGPETTCNLGIIEGGTGVNVVCPSVTIRAEARSTSVEDLDAQVDHMIQRFEEAAREMGAKFEVEQDRHYSSYTIPDDAQVVQVALRASQALGHNPELKTTLGGSDANMINAKGVPSIVCCTGMKEIHTHDEHVAREDLVKLAHLAYQLVIEAAR